MAENNSFTKMIMAEKRRAQQLIAAPAAVAGLGVKSTTLANIKYTRRLG